MEIILASGSHRRKELLGNMGIRNFHIVKPDFEEEGVQAPSPSALVETLSAGKAAAAAASLSNPNAIVIAADTVVALDNVVLGKPANREHAIAMLTSLSGKRHQVYTGVTVRQGDHAVTCHEVTAVTFRSLTPEEIEDYVATGEPMDKAGSYGIQGFGSLLVEGIEGDYFNVMGLPVCLLGQILKQFGVDCLTLCAQK